MLILSEEQIRSFYGMREALRDLAPALQAEHAGQVQNPPRLVLDVPEREASALYMPSAIGGLGAVGSKVVTVFPHNPPRGLPTIQGVTLLTEADTGQHVALLSASYLTRLRTGALTGLAAQHLARPQASRLGVIGTGGMALEQIQAVQEVRPLSELRLFNRTPDKAHTLAEDLRTELPGVSISVSPTAEALVEASDMLVASTQSSTPVFDGKALQPGTFISGIGSYLPSMREVDETTIRRASKVVLDTLEGTRHEAGELIHAEQQGFWSFEQAHSDLAGVVAGAKAGRQTEEEIIFFKCVGAAYFDLAVALGAYQEARQRGLGTEVAL
ncbi:ornithine cyclodeaminase [Deinococcus piscis]|uniref:Ornithine cyclodeaminase n=1 Tax=Deinococcus piscis TaxID=394230 RepID=A0ABQ3KAI3_9DEIO|nr:ornithine cyclodeaminase family protein [Deinococcus piscis]GHG04944.1 ornithine cyclodeaminase [Deinococcus piscis]